MSGRSEGRFREDVIRANNTQNVIKASDFRSNDPVQNDLKNRFAEYTRFGKSIQYMPKRTDIRKPNAVVIPLEEFAKSVYSFLRDPIRFSGSTSFLFDDGMDGGYRHIFGDGNVVGLGMPQEEFRLRSAIWWMAVSFGDRLRQERAKTTDVIEKAAQERKWPVIFSARLMLERSFGATSYQNDLRRTYKGEWEFGKDNMGKWFDELYDKAKRSVVYVYKQAAGKPGFVHRNWMRSEKTVEALAEFIGAGLLDPVKPLSEMK